MVSLSVWICVHFNEEGQRKFIDGSGLELKLSACVPAPCVVDMNYSLNIVALSFSRGFLLQSLSKPVRFGLIATYNGKDYFKSRVNYAR